MTNVDTPASGSRLEFLSTPRPSRSASKFKPKGKSEYLKRTSLTPGSNNLNRHSSSSASKVLDRRKTTSRKSSTNVSLTTSSLSNGTFDVSSDLYMQTNEAAIQPTQSTLLFKQAAKSGMNISSSLEYKKQTFNNVDKESDNDNVDDSRDDSEKESKNEEHWRSGMHLEYNTREANVPSACFSMDCGAKKSIEQEDTSVADTSSVTPVHTSLNRKLFQMNLDGIEFASASTFELANLDVEKFRANRIIEDFANVEEQVELAQLECAVLSSERNVLSLKRKMEEKDDEITELLSLVEELEVKLEQAEHKRIQAEAIAKTASAKAITLASQEARQAAVEQVRLALSPESKSHISSKSLRLEDKIVRLKNVVETERIKKVEDLKKMDEKLKTQAAVVRETREALHLEKQMRVVLQVELNSTFNKVQEMKQATSNLMQSSKAEISLAKEDFAKSCSSLHAYVNEEMSKPANKISEKSMEEENEALRQELITVQRKLKEIEEQAYGVNTPDRMSAFFEFCVRLSSCSRHFFSGVLLWFNFKGESDELDRHTAVKHTKPSFPS
eukprot:scaffold5287_cov59-Attheya_sp.AAC.5